MQTLVTFAKDPRLGHSKSRLARAVGEKAALEIANALLSDTMEMVSQVADDAPDEASFSVCYAPDDNAAKTRFSNLSTPITAETQQGATLGDRLIKCFADWFARGSDRVVIIGTDCPTVTQDDLTTAFELLHTADVVLGPAADGGYYLVGLSSPQPDLFRSIDWSGPDVLAQTAAIVREQSLKLRLVGTKSDLDTVDDLRPVLGQLEAYAVANASVGTATRNAINQSLTQSNEQSPNFEVVHFDDIDPVACPCGQARRAFAEAWDFPATVHQTEITLDAKPHYHATQTEVYVILECDSNAALELDGERIPVRVGSAILIRPGCVHRALGQMKVLIICSPKFDSRDEFVVSSPA